MDIRQEIQRLEQNYCVTAGAGAGKTTCLKDTYLGLLEQGLKPNQIVAITFTEKAAEEMRSRVVKAVAQKAQENASRDWHSLLPLVEWAPLTTIHSFCGSLLREFGVLLGLNPDFAVLDENEFAALLSETIQEVLREALSHASGALQRLLAHHPAQLESHISGLFNALRTDGISAVQARQATKQAHDDALEAGQGLVDEIARGMVELESICAIEKINPNAQYGKNIAALRSEWPAMKKALQADIQAPGVADRLFDLTKGNWQKAKPARDIIRPAVESLTPLQQIPQAAQLSDDLLSLVEQVSQQVEEECRRRSCLSFDDLLLLARDLLRNHPAVLNELRQRWQVLMVDEFQDVNPVQGELVRRLAGVDEENPVPKPPRLMVVGDRKQSIYAFRGADVTVFAKAMQEFPDLGGKVAALPENFRSQPGLIAFFNRLFEAVFKDAAHVEQAPLAFVDFRPDDEQQPGREHPQPDHPLVEIVEVCGLEDDDGPKLPAAAWLQMEANAIAAYLDVLINKQGVPPGRIALIFRRLTQIRVYEDALRSAGVGFYTVRGRGFYDCQEISDLYLALRALINPEDNLALAGFLRSPMIGLSDETLLALSYPDGQTFRHLSNAINESGVLPDWLGQGQAARWQKTLDLFHRLAPTAKRMSPAELIECLLEATGMVPVLMAGPAGEQKVANIRKLLETARDPQGALQGGAESFVRRLKALVEAPPNDPQAPLMGEEAQVVRLMSVHQAKGLEFPVVILPDLDAGKGPGGGLPISRDGVVGLKPRDPLTNKLISTPVSKDLAEFQAAVKEAETARLFYVACTRAEERLVFIQAQRGNEKAKGWAKWVEQIVRHDPAVNIINSADLGPPPSAQGQGPALAWPEMLPPAPGAMDEQGAAVVTRVLEPGPIAPLQNRVVRISVSGLENWFTCPRLSIITRLYGLDTAILPKRGAGNGGASSNIDPVALGSAVHKTLETADLGAGPVGLETALTAMEPDLAAEVRSLAKGAWDTDLAQLMEGLPASHFLREQPFRLWIAPTPPPNESPGVEVIGELDLLIVRPEPEPPVIVDYKVTPHIDPEHYRDQLALYALALWSGSPDGPVPRACLCYLRKAGAKLVELKFSAEELAAYRERVMQAAAVMAALPPDVSPADLPRGEGCAHCALSGHGLCPEAK